MNISTNQDGSGNLKTITEAVKSIQSPNTRRVIVLTPPGIYKIPKCD
jgi:hypothetical protein